MSPCVRVNRDSRHKGPNNQEFEPGLWLKLKEIRCHGQYIGKVGVQDSFEGRMGNVLRWESSRFEESQSQWQEFNRETWKVTQGSRCRQGVIHPLTKVLGGLGRMGLDVDGTIFYSIINIYCIHIGGHLKFSRDLTILSIMFHLRDI